MKKEAIAEDEIRKLMDEAVKNLKNKAIENVYDKQNEVDDKAQQHEKAVEQFKSFGAKKDLKRQKELMKIQKEYDSTRETDQAVNDQNVKNEMEMALLRMAENLVRAEMKMEENEKIIKEKEAENDALKLEMAALREENQALKGGHIKITSLRNSGERKNTFNDSLN